ncbi:MAG: hypothetical protein WD512_00150, partial [Candidatus Paceibacterota bacterium]
KRLDFVEKGIKNLNGNPINYTDNNKQNPLVLMGICMYDYSKINLFKTVDVVGTRNILNCETDSLFIHKKFLPLIEDKEWFGNGLGQINVEGISEMAIFNDKKNYYFNEKKQALKGIPAKHVKLEHYLKIAKGKDHRFEYDSVNKNLWGDKVCLNSVRRHRTVKGRAQHN